MYLKQLSLTQYKNIRSKTFDFNPKINCFVGDNGKGKSNILDAIYHLAFGKSYFNPIASQNIQLGEDFFVVEGRYEREEREEKIVCSLKKGQKKVMKRNGKVYEKLSDHIGLIPTVIISPADRDLIAEGSSTRRKFMDGVIGQTDAVFLQNLIEYHKILSQRNALLKFFALNNTFESDTLAVYNDQLSQRSSALYEKRKAFMETFIPVFNTRYQDISEGNERVDLEYESQLHQNSHKALLESSLEKDKILQYTSTGIHKDDINFLLEAQPIKKFGSQGQQKTFLIALKLAQFDFLKKQTGGAPLLLLDDAFDKLDQKRVTQIISLVDQNDFGQIFLTDTHEERTLNALHSLKSSYELFKL
ncbi:DNA replication and repair protein RecF [Flavobacteriaceae bacterium]|jgi:DNA replication and repair protein RecF|nr:DNA replication and repair protein RecF [Flavobacteriaceae bacterium]MDC3330046.1 DNA replication and repair protein RecF [Flavobacteriaceae bacterium]